MKFFFAILIAILIFSCGQPTEKLVSGQDTTVSDTAKQELLRMIEGGWVDEKYLHLLRKTRSPMSACSPLGGQQMTFNISNLSGDTLFNSDEEFLQTEECFNIIFYRKKDGKAGMKREEFRTTFYKREDGSTGIKVLPDANLKRERLLDFSFEGEDTILVCTDRLDSTISIQRFRHQYGKIPTRDSIVLRPVEYAVNENLFAGNWVLDGKIISFSTNGAVKNFKSFTRYSVDAFDENPEYQPDFISFYSGTGSESYVFTMIRGRMQLYGYTKDELSFTRGKMVYELERE